MPAAGERRRNEVVASRIAATPSGQGSKCLYVFLVEKLLPDAEPSQQLLRRWRKRLSDRLSFGRCCVDQGDRKIRGVSAKPQRGRATGWASAQDCHIDAWCLHQSLLSTSTFAAVVRDQRIVALELVELRYIRPGVR